AAPEAGARGGEHRGGVHRPRTGRGLVTPGRGPTDPGGPRSGPGDGRSAATARAALRGFISKEIRHILRDRQTLLVLLTLPLVQVLLFGFVIRTDVEDVRVGFVIPAPDVATSELVARFRGSDVFTTRGAWQGTGALPGLFERGEIDQAIV